MIRVVSSGLCTTVQDRGRWGYQHYGVPVAGPMDPVSHREANLLVGNQPSAATLEVTLVGPELLCRDAVVFAVTGAEFEVTLNGRPVAPYTSHSGQPEARIGFGRRVAGARAYLALAGGIDVPLVLGSRATHLSTAMGGMHGRPLTVGDEIHVGRETAATPAVPSTRRRVVPLPAAVTRLRVIPGPDDARCGPDAVARLCRESYRVTAQSDRMGYRLKGEPLQLHDADEMISAATPLGTVQVPPSGDPILLMADHQTTGGYPRIATVITADLPLAGQLAPTDTVGFVPCTHREAVQALIAQERQLLSV